MRNIGSFRRLVFHGLVSTDTTEIGTAMLPLRRVTLPAPTDVSPSAQRPAPSATSHFTRRPRTESRPAPRRPRGVALALAVLAVLATVAPEQAVAQSDTTFISNTGQTTNNISSEVRATAFTTGTGTYTLSSVGILLYNQTGTPTPVVQIYGDTSGNPGTLVATMGNPGTLQDDAVNTFTAPSNTMLSASTTYWLVTSNSAATDGTGFSVRTVPNTNLDSGAAAGWSIGNARWKSDITDTSWSSSSARLRFQIRGTGGTSTNTAATGAPTITGTATVGETLTAVTTAIMDDDGLTTPGYTYQWIRVAADTTETDIATATASTYTLVTDDLGATIKVKVSFTDDASNAETLTSAAFPSSGTVLAAHCNAGDTNELWCAILTVGTINDMGTTYYGYSSGSDADAYGGLAPSTFTYRMVTIDVVFFEYAANNLYFEYGRRAGSPGMTPPDGVLGAGSYTLEIGTGGDKKSFVKSNPGTSTTFNFTNPGLSWSSGDTVPIKLVRAPNTAPTSADSTVTATEDTDYAFLADRFPYMDMDAGARLVSVKIVTLPATGKGTLTLLDTALTSADLPQTVGAFALDFATLKYVPPANENGDDLTSFTFSVNDGAVDSDTHTLTIDVTAVNDPPTGELAIIGQPVFGDTLTLDYSAIMDVDGLPDLSLSNIDWYHVGTSSTQASQTTTYTLTRKDVGKALTVDMEYEDDDGEKEAVELSRWPTSGTITAIAPSAPTGLTATANGTTRIDLSWTGPANPGGTDITGYKIEISPNGTDTWTTHLATTGDANTTYAHTGLAAGTTRHYRVSAINTIGTSTASNVDYATTGNTAPTVANTIPDQSATAGTEFSYAFPDTTFTDADSDTLTYMATKADSDTLPTWLTFTAGTRTFSGMPGAADVATVAVKVTASDGKGGSVSDEFDITVRADPLAHCNAGDTNELWCASLTVGTFYDGPNTYLGYASGTGAYGSLAPNTFPYGTATIGVTVLEYEIANFFDFVIERNAGTTPATGLLGSGIYTLEIGTGGTKKSFVTNNPGTGTDFNFRGHGLSWSMGDTVPVKLVRAPNTAPTSADGMVTATEDTVYTFRATDFPFTDTDTGHQLESVKIVTLPASGTLTRYGVALTSIDLPQTITTGDLDAVNNALKYSPPANENGDDLASFTFRVNDGGDDSGTHTMTIDVTAVNDTATGQPGITGTAQVGQVLTAAAGTIADPDGLPNPFLTDTNTSFQWVRVTSGTDDDISGETASTYTLVTADEGKTIKVKVSFQDAGGGSEGPFTSAATAVVSAAPDTTPPTLISADVPDSGAA